MRYQFVVAGYVVMPEHIHLLISEPQEKTPSTVMQALKIGFARCVIAEVRRHGASNEATSRKAREVAHLHVSPPIPVHIWQKRFYDFNVWSEHKRVEKLRYMHRNPVKRGLVASPELWGWSSFRGYFLGETGPVRVNDWEVLKMKIRPPAAQL
jgi:putative transposase